MEMKDNAPALDLDMPKDKVWQGAYYGNPNVPHRTNEPAKHCPEGEAMHQVHGMAK